MSHWKWTFDGDGFAIQDYASTPPECNWVVIVTHVHDTAQAAQLVAAVGGAVSATAAAIGGKVAAHVGSNLVTAMETAIDGLFFRPKRLGTFIGSADGSELSRRGRARRTGIPSRRSSR